jgi:hypothetical protein
MQSGIRAFPPFPAFFFKKPRERMGHPHSVTRTVFSCRINQATAKASAARARGIQSLAKGESVHRRGDENGETAFPEMARSPLSRKDAPQVNRKPETTTQKSPVFDENMKKHFEWQVGDGQHGSEQETARCR